MKATIDIPDHIYRQVKAKSALEGKRVREVAILLFQRWVEGEEPSGSALARTPDSDAKTPSWFGALRKYAGNAGGRHDMESIRASIARGRTEKPA